MSRLVAVDGGQSSTRLLMLPDGRTGTGPGFPANADRVRTNVELVREAAEDAGLVGRIDVACVGLSGHPSTPAGVAELAAGLAKVLDAGEVRTCGDMVSAHAGALPDGFGVVVAAGTGVVCLAVDRDGRWHKVDGGGYLFGDAGSAFAIGRAGLAAILRARDGRGPETTLDGADPTDLYTSRTLVEDVARFAPAVLSAAAAGDPVSQEIVVSAAADLADTIAAAVSFLPGQVPVSYVGGLFRAGEQLLAPLRERLPGRAELRPPAGSPLDGAVRLASGPPGPYAGLVAIHR